MPRTAIIAGVGPRIGESTARKFAEEGLSVGLFARSEGYLDALADELTAETAGEATAVPTDITDPSAVEAGFEAVRDAYGPVDVLVNNAYPTGDTGSGLAETGDGPLGPTRPAFERSWRVWTLGAFLCSERAVADMRGGDGGTIILTGSAATRRGTGDTANHSAGFAARGLARSLAHDLWPEGIHVAHALVDGAVGRPDQRDWADLPDEQWMHPDAVADAYWFLVEQPRSAWTLELDLRAHAADISFG